jgi:hypothetical protein
LKKKQQILDDIKLEKQEKKRQRQIKKLSRRLEFRSKSTVKDYFGYLSTEKKLCKKVTLGRGNSENQPKYSFDTEKEAKQGFQGSMDLRNLKHKSSNLEPVNFADYSQNHIKKLSSPDLSKLCVGWNNQDNLNQESINRKRL